MPRLRDEDPARLDEHRAPPVLHAPAEVAFRDLAAAAAEVAGTPVALVGLLDDGRHWSTSTVGDDAGQVSRALGLCASLRGSSAPVVVEDALAHPAFRDHPSVADGTGLRSYAGYPLVAPSGEVLGTLCVADAEPRALDGGQRRLLQVLADQAVARVDLRRQARATADAARGQAAASERLAASEARYRLLAEGASDIVSRHAPDGTVLWVSPSLRTVLGDLPGPEPGAPDDRVHPDDRPLVARTVAATVQGGGPLTVTFRARHADGGWRWLEATVRALRDDDGEVVELHSAARDVTARREASVALADTEQRYRALVEQTPDAILACAQGRVVFANDAAAALLRAASPDALLGTAAPALTGGPGDPVDDPVALALVAAPGAGRAAPVRGRVRALDGDEVAVDVSAWPVRLDGRDAVQVVLRDASADEAAAAAERTVQEQHRTLFERSPVGQAEIAPDGEVLRVNEAFARLVGRPVEDLVGRTVGDLAGLSPGEARLSAQAAGTGPRSTEHVFPRPDGTAVQAQVSTTAVRGPDGSVRSVVATVVDMTERNAARAALEHLVDELRLARDESDQRAALLDAVLDTIDVGVVACDAEGRLTLFNRAARDFHGLGEDPDLDPGQWAQRYRFWDEAAAAPLPPEEVPLSRALVDGQVHDRLVTLAAEGGPPRVVRCDGRALPGPGGGVAGAVVAMKDVTALRASEQRFRAAFHDGPAPMARLDAAGAVREANPALRRFLSLPTSRLLGRPLADLLHPDDAAVLPHVLAGTGAEPAEARVVRADGAAVWCEVATTAGTAADGEQYVLVQLLDVDARKTNELELERIARVDPLTGLGNRTVLRAELARHLDPAVGTGAAVLFLDLDGFKQVNDVHGHSAGDAVLVETAARLQLAVRPGDTVVRTGGDEFVVVCPLPAAAAAEPADAGASALAGRVEQALSRPVVHRGALIPAAASVGSAVGRPGEDLDALLRRADLVMYGRKAARRTHRAGDPAEQAGGELA